MQKSFLRVLNIIVILFYPHIPKKYCYYIRDNYFSKILQKKYYLKDFLHKKKYKIVEYHGEFQQELTFVLPFAYWHFLNGTLLKTVSSGITKELYFFSSNHEETITDRHSKNNAKTYEIPNMTHSISFCYKKWAKVPFQQYYKNEIYLFEKPILIIANKYNVEWDNDPVNFFDIPMLDKIITCCKHKYQVIYNRPLAVEIVSDNNEILDMGEYKWLKKHHPEVLLMNDLFAKHNNQVNNFNHLQLMVYANCRHFVSIHGGSAALASYFGGTNIIYSKNGLEHIFNEFNTIFPKLSGAKILHAKTEEKVFTYLESYYK